MPRVCRESKTQVRLVQCGKGHPMMFGFELATGQFLFYCERCAAGADVVHGEGIEIRLTVKQVER